MPFFKFLKNNKAKAVSYSALLSTLAGSLLLWPGPLLLGVIFSTAMHIRYKKRLIEFCHKYLKEYNPSPEVSPNLVKIFKELCQAAGFTTGNIPIYAYEIDESKKGEDDIKDLEKAITGRGSGYSASSVKSARPIVIISRPLLEIIDDEELKSTLAHELGHLAARLDRYDEIYVPDGIKSGAVIGSIISAVTLGIAGADISGIAKILSEASVICLSTNLAVRSLRRSREYDADAKVAELGASPLGMITTLRKLSCEEYERRRGRLSQLWEGITSCHPLVGSRISHLAGIARQQGYSEGEINRAVNAPIDPSLSPGSWII